LKCIHDHLTRKGLLIFDLIPPQLLTKGKHLVKEIDGGRGRTIKITQYGEDDFSRKPPVFHVYRTYEEKKLDGSTQITEWREHICYLTREEMEHLLMCRGFKVLNVFKNFKKDPYDPDAESNMWFVAKRSEK